MGKIALRVQSYSKEKRAKLMRLLFNPSALKTHDSWFSNPGFKNEKPPTEEAARWQPMMSADEKWRLKLLKLVQRRKLEREFRAEQSQKKRLFSKVDELFSIASRNQKAISQAFAGNEETFTTHVEPKGAVEVISPLQEPKEPLLSSTVIEEDMNSVLRDASMLSEHQPGRAFLSTILEEHSQAKSLSHVSETKLSTVADNYQTSTGEADPVSNMAENSFEQRKRKCRRTSVYYRVSPPLTSDDSNGACEVGLGDSSGILEPPASEAVLDERSDIIEPPPSPHQYIPDAESSTGGAIQVCGLTNEANTCPSSPGCSNSPENADINAEDTNVVNTSQGAGALTSTRRRPVFPVRKLLQKLKKSTLMRVWIKSAVYTAAVLEYIVSEILDLGGYIAKGMKKKILTPSHINGALKIDQELSKLTSNVIVPFASKIP